MAAGRRARTGATAAQYATASALRSARSARLSPMRGLLLTRLPGADVAADRVHAREVLREQIGVAHRDPETLLQEHHQPQQVQRIENAGLQKRCLVRERQQPPVLDEFLADVVVDDRLHLSTFLSLCSPLVL